MIIIRIICLLLSPAVWAILKYYPTVGWMILLLAVNLIVFRKRNVVIYLGTGLMVIWLTNQIFLKSSFPIKEYLSTKITANEVNRRFDEESYLQNKVVLPGIIRKIGYNRYSFMAKNIIKGTIGGMDLDKIFFQEKSPMFLNSVVIFQWWWIWPFILGVFSLYKLTNKQELLYWTILAVGQFWLNDGPIYVRLSIFIMAISMVNSIGLMVLIKRK